jgi:hypothetical protein
LEVVLEVVEDMVAEVEQVVIELLFTGAKLTISGLLIPITIVGGAGGGSRW